MCTDEWSLFAMVPWDRVLDPWDRVLDPWDRELVTWDRAWSVDLSSVCWLAYQRAVMGIP